MMARNRWSSASSVICSRCSSKAANSCRSRFSCNPFDFNFRSTKNFTQEV